MSIAVTIVTTANRTRCFTQTDEASIKEVLESLRRSGQLFSNRTLIIGSAHETEIFSPASITRIEIETKLDLGNYLPQHGETPLTLMTSDSTTPPEEISETHFSGQVDVFFEGGDTISTWMSAPRPSGISERMSNLTRLFDKAVLMYKLPAGGVGFMNPAVMTRVKIAAGVEKLPLGSWQLNAVV
jgi:hypothetical protein